MATIEEVYEAFSQVKLREHLPQLIKQTEYQLIGKIIRQHQFGLLGTGNKITPSYKSAKYALFKQALNPVPGYGTPDGILTGAYNNELKLTVTAEEYSVESEVSYAQAPSLKQYGESFNQLSDESASEYCEETLRPEIMDYIEVITGIVF